MEKRNNTNSISDLLTPFKNKNPKLNTHIRNIQQNESYIIQKSSSSIKPKSLNKISLSNLIHSVSSYRKEIGDELKIDAESIKPSNLIHGDSNKSLLYPKSVYNSKKKDYSLNSNLKKTPQKIILKKGFNNSNFNYVTNVDDKITVSVETEDRNDFFDLFSLEKLAKFETKFLILLAKTKTKTTKYQREEYIKFLEDLKLNPFFEYFSNINQIKSNNNLTAIKSSINLVILSIISCLWVTNNNDIIDNNEMINKYLIELITNDHQLYLLMCLYILNEMGYLNNNQSNGRIMRLIEQIKTYLNKKIADFNDKEITLKEIRSSNLKIIKIISKILNFESLYCTDISNCLADIDIITISFLYSLFEKMKMSDNINFAQNVTVGNPNDKNYLHSIYQRRPLLQTNNINKNMKSNEIYVRKFGNYSSRKNQNKNSNNIINITINNNNINNKNINNENSNNIEVDSTFISVNRKKLGNDGNYSDQINNLYKNKSYRFDISNKNKKINFRSVINRLKNFDNIPEENIVQKTNDKSLSNNKTMNYPIIDTSDNMVEYQPKYFPHKTKIFNKYQTNLENTNLSTPINTENNYQKYNNKYNTAYSNNYYCNTNNNNEPLSSSFVRLYKNNKKNQKKFDYLSKNLNSPSVPYLPENNSGKKYTLILDLDETLVQFHYNKMKQNNNGEKVILRPGLFEFLNRVYPIFELIIWTVATKQYSDPIIDIIEEKKKYFSTRLYREYATEKDEYFVKDLTKLGREIDKIIIVDDKEVSFSLQPENGILIKPFLGSYLECRDDNVLFDLFKILTKIILIKSQDVRNGIKNYKYEIQQKVSKIFSKVNVYDNPNDIRTERDDISYDKKNKQYEKIMNQNRSIEKFDRNNNSVRVNNIRDVKNKY